MADCFIIVTVNPYIELTLIYERDDDGAEILFVENKEWASYNHNGELISRHRTERVKHVDDDLPKISTAYKKFLEGLL